jgi:hypothetical protein
MCGKGARRFWKEERFEIMMGGADCEAPGVSCPVVVVVVCVCVCSCVLCVCERERECVCVREREDLHDKEYL